MAARATKGTGAARVPGATARTAEEPGPVEAHSGTSAQDQDQDARKHQHQDRGAEGAAPEGEFSLLLDDQLCFALYAASRAVTARYRPLLEGLGLTYPQYLVMLFLWERGAAPVKEVGAALQLDYGTLTPLLKRLESAGLLRRERRADDERSVRVVPTDDGVALRERARGVPAAMGEAMGLAPEEVAAARGLLRRLADNVSASAG